MVAHALPPLGLGLGFPLTLYRSRNHCPNYLDGPALAVVEGTQTISDEKKDIYGSVGALVPLS